MAELIITSVDSKNIKAYVLPLIHLIRTLFLMVIMFAPKIGIWPGSKLELKYTDNTQLAILIMLGVALAGMYALLFASDNNSS